MPEDRSAPSEPKPESAAPADASAPPETVSKAPEVPLAAFVFGGTHSSGHDQMLAKSIFEAEKRREAADQERGLVQDGAQEYVNKLTPHGSAPQAYVLLTFVNRRGETLHGPGGPTQCLADIFLEDDPNNLILQIVCLRCQERASQGEMQFNQIRIAQKNRAWHLDGRTKGELIMFEGKAYRSAGQVVDSDVMTCPACRYQFRIDKNKVWPA